MSQRAVAEVDSPAIKSCGVFRYALSALAALVSWVEDIRVVVSGSAFSVVESSWKNG